MELVFQGFGKEYVIEVGENDTTETMRQKVASAAGLCEDSFRMGFGGKDEGEDITQLSAGDIVVLEKTPKYEALAALHALGETDPTTETLRVMRDPKVVSLLLQAEVATALPDYFFSHSDVAHIRFGCVSDVDDNCGITLDLPALPCVTAIGTSFFSYCTTLSTVDLSSLQAVTSIGENFLSSCRGLSTADLSGLRAVTTIGNSFLSNCTMLSTLDITGLQAVTTIGNSFLFGCTGLNLVDFSGLRAVTMIGSWFLYRCTGLAIVDLSGLQSVTTIGCAFISECTKLSTVNVSGLRAVTTIAADDSFLSGCPALQTVPGKDTCSNVVRSSVELLNL